jgi:hypothetical protein
MKLEECATLEEIHDWLDHGGVTDGDGHPAENIKAALQHAAELGRQQGWNEAIEAAAGHLRVKREPYRIMWDVAADEIAALKMPTQEKAKG